jgi:hypothetical protein
MAVHKEEPIGIKVVIPRESLDENQIERLKEIVRSKKVLIAHAFGTEDATIAETEQGIEFPTLNEVISPESVHAYNAFVTGLCNLARTLKRTNIREEKTPENEKYAFRCFLIRLGMIGPQSKADRKILLGKLSGSSAFRDAKAGGKSDENDQ